MRARRHRPRGSELTARRPICVALCASLVAAAAASAAGFTAQSSNPGSSFAAASSFCANPREQVIAADRDAYVDALLPVSNFGGSTALNVRPAQALVLSQRRALVGFALPAIPTFCTLEAATLRLYATSPGAGRTIDVLRLNGTWTETGVTWANAPATTGAAASSSSLASAGRQTWNVLGQVQAMYSGANHGFLVKDSQDSAVLTVQQAYQSRDGTPDAQDPELRLTFG